MYNYTKSSVIINVSQKLKLEVLTTAKMKILSLVATLVTLANAGVVPWTKSGEDYAAKLFLDYCLNADHGVNGNVHWFCKQPNIPLSEEVFEHYKEINGPSQVQKQVIFVQTPSRTYKHKVFVKGQSGVQQDTNVYVIPAKNRHQIEINGDIQTNAGVNKPHTFYLKKDPTKNGGANKPSYGAQPTQQYSAAHGGLNSSPGLSSYSRSRRQHKKDNTVADPIDTITATDIEQAAEQSVQESATEQRSSVQQIILAQ